MSYATPTQQGFVAPAAYANSTTAYYVKNPVISPLSVAATDGRTTTISTVPNTGNSSITSSGEIDLVAGSGVVRFTNPLLAATGPSIFVNQVNSVYNMDLSAPGSITVSPDDVANSCDLIMTSTVSTSTTPGRVSLATPATVGGLQPFYMQVQAQKPFNAVNSPGITTNSRIDASFIGYTNYVSNIGTGNLTIRLSSHFPSGAILEFALNPNSTAGTSFVIQDAPNAATVASVPFTAASGTANTFRIMTVDGVTWFKVNSL